MSNVSRCLIFVAGFVFLLLPGCSGLSPEIIQALAKDSASFCATSDIRGGAGTITAPTGGYGQGTFSFCRSNFPNSKLSVSPEGSISIEHGEGLQPHTEGPIE